MSTANELSLKYPLSEDDFILAKRYFDDMATSAAAISEDLKWQFIEQIANYSRVNGAYFLGLLEKEVKFYNDLGGQPTYSQ